MNSALFVAESIKGLGRDVVYIDGVRTPFLQGFTSYKDLMGYHLARHALLYVRSVFREPSKDRLHCVGVLSNEQTSISRRRSIV